MKEKKESDEKTQKYYEKYHDALCCNALGSGKL